MADTESGQNGQTGNEQRSISNTMGGIVIAVLLAVGSVIVYQKYQLNMAISVLNMMAQEIATQRKK